MSSCLINHNVETCLEKKDDSGFMGKTHSTSAIAIFLLGIAFLPAFSEKFLGTDNIWLVIMAAITFAGASLIPDIDNTSSHARNSLGPVGALLSTLIRGASIFLQTVIRTSKDNKEPDPHRGAAHTIPAALVFGLIGFIPTRLHGSVTLPGLGEREYGQIGAVFVLFVMIHMGMASLFKPFVNKIGKGPLGEITEFLFSFAISVALFYNAPSDTDYWWLSVSIFAGCVIHILGDCFTTSGAPILFPVSVFFKGRFWWNTRFLPIKAGGAVENFVFVPLFSLAIIVAIGRIAGLY